MLVQMLKKVHGSNLLVVRISDIQKHESERYVMQLSLGFLLVLDKIGKLMLRAQGS